MVSARIAQRLAAMMPLRCGVRIGARWLSSPPHQLTLVLRAGFRQRLRRGTCNVSSRGRPSDACQRTAGGRVGQRCAEGGRSCTGLGVVGGAVVGGLAIGSQIGGAAAAKVATVLGAVWAARIGERGREEQRLSPSTRCVRMDDGTPCAR